MFVVYYNCYFSKYVVHFAPYWIDTEQFVKEKEEEEKIRSRQIQKICKKQEVQEDVHNLSICVETNTEEKILIAIAKAAILDTTDKNKVVVVGAPE